MYISSNMKFIILNIKYIVSVLILIEYDHILFYLRFTRYLNFLELGFYVQWDRISAINVNVTGSNEMSHLEGVINGTINFVYHIE